MINEISFSPAEQKICKQLKPPTAKLDATSIWASIGSFYLFGLSRNVNSFPANIANASRVSIWSREEQTKQHINVPRQMIIAIPVAGKRKTFWHQLNSWNISPSEIYWSKPIFLVRFFHTRKLYQGRAPNCTYSVIELAKMLTEMSAPSTPKTFGFVSKFLAEWCVQWRHGLYSFALFWFCLFFYFLLTLQKWIKLITLQGTHYVIWEVVLI